MSIFLLKEVKFRNMTQLEIDGQFHRTHFGSFGLVAEGEDTDINGKRLCPQVGETDVSSESDTRQNDTYLYKSNSASTLIEKVQRYATSFNLTNIF